MTILDTFPFTRLEYMQSVSPVVNHIYETTAPTSTIVSLLVDPVGKDYLVRKFKDIVGAKEVPLLRDKNTGGLYPVTAVRQLKDGRVQAFILLTQK
jgi:hypothetical protein